MCRRISLGKSNVVFQDNDISSLTFIIISFSTSVTYSIFLSTDDIAPKKKSIYISILELAPVIFISEVN